MTERDPRARVLRALGYAPGGVSERAAGEGQSVAVPGQVPENPDAAGEVADAGTRTPTAPAELVELVDAGLASAAHAGVERLTVMNPVSRPVALQLAPLATDTRLDTMYAQEWAEFSVSSEGALYLVFRRRDGNDYAVEWSRATRLPDGLLGELPPVLLAGVVGSG